MKFLLISCLILTDQLKTRQALPSIPKFDIKI